MGGRKDFLGVSAKGSAEPDEYEKPRGAFYVVEELVDYLIYITLFFTIFSYFFLSRHCLDGVLSFNYVLYGTILLPVFLQLLFFIFEVTDDDDSHFPVIGLVRSFTMPLAERRRAIGSRALKFSISLVFLVLTAVATNFYYLHQFSYDQDIAEQVVHLGEVYNLGGRNVMREHLYAWPVLSDPVYRERFVLLAPTILDDSAEAQQAVRFLQDHKPFVRQVVARNLQPDSSFYRTVDSQTYSFQADALLRTFPQLQFLSKSISRKQLEAYKWLWLYTLEQKVFGNNQNNLITRDLLGKFMEDQVLPFVPDFVRISGSQGSISLPYQKEIAAHENSPEKKKLRSQEFAAIYPLLSRLDWQPGTIASQYKKYAKINSDPLIEIMHLTEPIWKMSDERVRFFSCGSQKAAKGTISAYMLNYLRVPASTCD